MASQGTKKPQHRGSKWKPIMLVTVYRLVRLGIAEIEVCKELKVSRRTFLDWKTEHPELAECLAIAGKELEDGKSFPRWIYSKLTPEVRKVWDAIQKVTEENNGFGKIELILQDHGKRVRQQLFLYALCLSDFSASEAMARVHISKWDLDRWCEEEDFKKLLEEIGWHKGNFFEQALVGLVKEGNPAAVLFANKNYNRDRGYGSHSTVDVNHSGQVLHGVVDLAEIMSELSETTKLELLTIIRKREEARNAAPATPQQKMLDHISRREDL